MERSIKMGELQIKEKSIKVRVGSVSFPDYERIKAEATELAELIRTTEVSEENIKSIGQLAAKYIVKCNLVDQTIAFGAVEFMEGLHRPLKRKKRDMKFYQN